MKTLNVSLNNVLSYQLEILNELKNDFTQEQLCEIVVRHSQMFRKACNLGVSPYIVASEVRDYELCLV